MDQSARTININEYNAAEGKLKASLKWLIARCYTSTDVPDNLSNLFYIDEKSSLQLLPVVVVCLKNGSLYSQAASKILHDNALVGGSISSVLHALSSINIEVREADGSHVTEDMLTSPEKPLQISSHVALIDALMTAHLKSVISIEKVVQAVSDEVENYDVPLQSNVNDGAATIPEMEDLYEDLCDGTCVSVLLSFYRPNEVPIRDIYFNDPMSINDCRFNLSIIKIPSSDDAKEICAYTRNTGSSSSKHCESASAPSESQPIFAWIFSKGSHYFRCFCGFFDDIKMNEVQENDETTKKSHTVQKSAAEVKLQMEELRRQLERSKMIQSVMDEEKRSKAGKDAFFRVMSKSANEDELSHLNTAAANAQYTPSRDDINRDLHNYQQEHIDNRKKSQHESMNHTAPHQEFASPPFSRNMQTMSPNFPQHAHTLQNIGHAAMIGQHVGQLPYDGTQMGVGMPPQNYEQGHYALPQAALGSHNYNSPYSVGAPTQLYGGNAVDPMFYGQQYQQQQPRGFPNNNNFYQPPFHSQQMQSSNSQPNALNLIHQHQQMGAQPPYGQYQPGYAPPMQPNHHYAAPSPYATTRPPEGMMSYSVNEHFTPQYPSDLTSPTMASQSQFLGAHPSGQSAFRLHQPNASASRLDPPLEINRNLTNWGLTYGERTPRKMWDTYRSEQNINAAAASVALSTGTIGHGEPDAANNVTPRPSEEPKTTTHAIIQENKPAPACGSPLSTQTPNADPNTNAVVPKQMAPKPTGFFETASVGNPEMTAEMQAKRRALLANQIKRKEKVVLLTDQKEQEVAEKRQQELEKQEEAEQRKMERELKRQKLLEDYKRKKMEQELGESPSGSNSARASSSSTASLSRGHSQPPFGRPKSQSNMSTLHTRTLQRPGRNQTCLTEDDNNTPRIRVPSIAEPTLKLFAKHQPKSNRVLILNALQHSIFPGTVSSEQKNKAQTAIAQSDSKHFLVLFRDHKCQYRGLYTWDQISDTTHRIDGSGPKICNEDMMTLMFKYDSGAKHFSRIPTKHLSATIDGFTIGDNHWQKTKIPHSSR
ncbi:microtubule-binding calmodulin-regulated spectrin-associated domain-containing protein [Ditylenchus destructor]|uniref:Microtubule-binding calmodulin-regulated spectrin-associated domain-containing protein n=1 Tax=Ditylenchus destructor TaxID=166010 RepID=A0AAD4N5N4_9BILA|nr:microtubule-binding calmodulin-regulated spectrin-associated domain-containing protein [Ditylenchus destructor]